MWHRNASGRWTLCADTSQPLGKLFGFHTDCCLVVTTISKDWIQHDPIRVYLPYKIHYIHFLRLNFTCFAVFQLSRLSPGHWSRNKLLQTMATISYLILTLKQKKQRAVATVDQGDWLVDEADFLFLLKHTRYCWIMSKLTCHLGLDIFVYLNVISDIFHTPVGEVHECETLDTSFCFDVAGLSPLRSHSLVVQHHHRKVRGRIGVVASSCSFRPQDAWY